MLSKDPVLLGIQDQGVFSFLQKANRVEGFWVRDFRAEGFWVWHSTWTPSVRKTTAQNL